MAFPETVHGNGPFTASEMGGRRQRGKMERMIAVAAFGVLLVGVAVVAFSQQRSDHAHSTFLDETSSSDKARPLSGTERKKVEEEVRKLNLSAQKEEEASGKLEKEVEDKERALRHILLKAKKEREDGDSLEDQARKDVGIAAKMRAEAVKLEKESDAAKKKFVGAEKPVEMATRLTRHDHQQYRKDELSVAHDVVALSEHPTNKKLKEQVDKLVSKARHAQKKLSEDQHILSMVENQAAQSQLGGREGYARLKEKSVNIAKEAEAIAERAVSLANEGGTKRKDAEKSVDQVKERMAGPEKMHKEAQAERGRYEDEVSKAKVLEKELSVKAAKPQSKDHVIEKSVHKDGYGGDLEGGEKGGKEVYHRDRKELEKMLGREDAASEAKGEAENSKRSSITTDAQNSYDKLEEAEMKKERERHDHRSDSGSSSGPEVQSARAKAAHLLSSKQSTFLSGLFSNKAPWDSDKDREDR